MYLSLDAERLYALRICASQSRTTIVSKKATRIVAIVAIAIILSHSCCRHLGVSSRRKQSYRTGLRPDTVPRKY